MKHSFIITFVFSATIFFSCNSSSSKEEKNSAAGSTTPTPAQTAQPVTTPATNQPVQQTNAVPAANTVPAPATQNANNTATAAAGLNPKHGMPGHRCDIPEGAPLNSPPSSNIVTPQQVQTNPVTVSKTQSVSIPQPTPVTTTAPTGPGLNPEHGKPGHRCDIAVGAPLSSAPVKQ